MVYLVLLIFANLYKVSCIVASANNMTLFKAKDLGTTNVIYGAEGTIKCDIRSSVPMNILWTYTNEITGENTQISPSNKYAISADGTQLKIKKMDPDLVGIYTCTAVYSTRVKILPIKPKVTGVSDKKSLKGRTAVIECKILKGFPKPNITWQFTDKSISKFIPMAGFDNVLHISSAQEKHAGRYKCVAVNNAGSDEHVTTLTIQDPPNIISNNSTAYESIEGKGLLRIPCAATGLPKPSITWHLNGLTIIPSAKYFIEDGALIIRNPRLNDTNSYTCEAKNEVGFASATFQANVLQTPKVSGIVSQNVRTGTPAKIECKILKGKPKPKITWQFMDISGSKFVPLDGTDNILHIPNAVVKHAGRYKCVAQNSVGNDEHATTLIIEYAPRITSDSTKIYEGVEGDIALRVSCNVVGIPQPAITWNLKDVTITQNAKYSIGEGALVIMNPNETDSTTYTCIATNYMGSVSENFRVKVEKFINGYGLIHYVYLLNGETKTLECGNIKSKSQSVRWFIEEVDMNLKTPYLLIERATVSHDGNYTCRVSDIHGNTYTHTYFVDVGYSPQFKYDYSDVVYMRGDVKDILSNCDVEAKPSADVKWKFNGELLTNRNLTELDNSFKWGRYSCNVSNVHGSVERKFDVDSSICLIKKKFEDGQNIPILLSSELTWPNWETAEQYYIVENQQNFILSCPKYLAAPNTFQKFPNKNELTVSCNKQDTFLVDGKLYRLPDLQCRNSIYPSIIKTKVKCSTSSSELIRVGYGTSKPLETYEICFDNAKNIPIYARVVMSNTDSSLSTSHNWFIYPVINDGKSDTGLICRNSVSSCCYGKTQLVNAKDFKYEPAIKSTFIDPLNTVTYWHACDNSTEKTTWEDIADKVRSQLNIYDQFIAWSGTHTLQDINGAVIPRFLWKVLKFDEDDSLAIVHVNDPSPTDKDIKCKNICADDESWLQASGKYTYCCSLSDFLDAFGMRGTSVGE